MSLSPNQIKLIRATVPVLQKYGNTITTKFYENVLRDNPSLHNVFNQTNQLNGHQAQALAGSLLAYASHVDDLGALSPAVEKICHKHASLYIQPEHYSVVGEYLLQTMGEVLGTALTPEIRDAWTAAYWQLARIFINREARMYAESDGWVDWRDFVVSDKVPESDEITSFYLRPADGRALPEFLPGQYISLLVDVPQFGYTQSRQYSLSDAPNAQFYRISVKKESGLDPYDPAAMVHPGWISNILHRDKTVGDTIKLSHPAGDFFLDPTQNSDGPVVLLSAGVGITPMVSILNTLVQKRSKEQIAFIHGARSSTAQAFAKHVRQQASSRDNVHAVFFISNPTHGKDVEGVDYEHPGRLDIGKLDEKQDLHLHEKQTRYFVCGPESFMAGMWAGLRAKGIDPGRIKMEVFGTGEILEGR